jgi:geranylgeranyl reductase family protein
LKIQEKTDVIVVGGGPAGVLSAIVIAREGYKVTILDKKKRHLIGNKNCGEALDRPAPTIIKEELNIEFPKGEEMPSKIAHLAFAAGEFTNMLKANTPAFITDRLIYGQRLIHEAEKNDVNIIAEAKVRELIIEGDQIKGVRYNQNSNQIELKSKIVIDASGFIAIVRKLLPAEMKKDIQYEVPDYHIVSTYREIVELEVEHEFQEEIVLWYLEQIPPPGYAWIFTSGPKKLNIGITWPKNIPYPSGKSLKEIYHDILDPIVRPSSYKVINSGGGQIPIRPPFDSLVFNGVILVGDAGCFVDPTTAEGHGPALISGFKAGKAVINALKNKSYRIDDLWQYNMEVMQYPGVTHTMSFHARKYVEQIGSQGFSILLKRKIISEEDLRYIFEKQEFSFSIRKKIQKLILIFPHYNLLMKLIKTLDLIEKTRNVYLQYPDNPRDLKSWRKLRNETLKVDF